MLALEALEHGECPAPRMELDGRVLPAQHREGDAYRGRRCSRTSTPRLRGAPHMGPRASTATRRHLDFEAAAAAAATAMTRSGSGGRGQRIPIALPWLRGNGALPLVAESPVHAASSAYTAIHTSVKVDGDGVGCASVWTGVKTTAEGTDQKFLEAEIDTTNFGPGPGPASSPVVLAGGHRARTDQIVCPSGF